VRILLVSQYFWPENFRINDLVTLLQDEGCEVTVLTGQPNYPGGTVFEGYHAAAMGRDSSATAYEIVRVPLVPRGKGGGLRLAVNYLSFVITASLFGPWLLRGRSYDVVFVYGISPILQALPAIVLARLKRGALVLWVQDLWPQSLEVTGYIRNRRLLNAVGGVTAWIYRRCDLILGQSRSFVRTIAQMAGGVPVDYFPNPGDTAPEPRPGDAPAATLPGGFTVVFAGNLGIAQALPTILDAATALGEHDDVRFVFLGDGTLREWLLEETRRRGLANVVWLGQFPAAAMPGVLAQASVLLASLNRSEVLAQTIPSKIATYLKAGRPIIAAIDGEGGEVVEQAAAGIACPAEDAQALADAVLKLRALPAAERDALGASGRRYYELNFEPRLLAKTLLELLRGAAAKSPRQLVEGR
jgi:glycosyltransferase involved in cell wall biosynthesis